MSVCRHELGGSTPPPNNSDPAAVTQSHVTQHKPPTPPTTQAAKYNSTNYYRYYIVLFRRWTCLTNIQWLRDRENNGGARTGALAPAMLIPWGESESINNMSNMPSLSAGYTQFCIAGLPEHRSPTCTKTPGGRGFAPDPTYWGNYSVPESATGRFVPLSVRP